MKTTHYHQSRILINYVFMKLNHKVNNLSQQELADFFDQRGWYLYDLSDMVQDFEQWRSEKDKSILA